MRCLEPGRRRILLVQLVDNSLDFLAQSTVGQSVQLSGSGASYADFTWTAPAANTFGSVNAHQNFIGGNATGLVSIADAQVKEGDSGTTQLLVTVHRAGYKFVG